MSAVPTAGLPGAETTTCDVVVVGGGPAGLTTALRLATAGRSVVLVDEQPQLGGQYYRRPSPAVLAQGHDHRPEGGRLVTAVRDAGVQCWTGTSVWGLAADGRTLLTAGANGLDPVRQVAGRHVVVATGAYEHLVPFPGWQLLGVTTVGFAQHLAAADRTAIGDRVLLAGSGPFLLQVACSLLDVGVQVVGVAEAGHPYRPSLRRAAALAYPARLVELAGYAARLARHRVPVWQGRVVARAQAVPGGQRVGTVVLARTQAPGIAVATHDVDALCVGMGFRPQTELVRLLGCATEPDPRTGDLLPVTDQHGRTSRDDVYVAGEVSGIGGAQLAAAEAAAVADAILRTTSSGPSGARTAAAARTARRLRRARRFVALTDSLYPSAGQLNRSLAPSLPDEVRVCRCEAVTAGEIRSAAGTVGRDVSAVKGVTRAGMGPCQGRECSALVAVLAGAPPGRPAAVRMPLRPVSLSALAALAESQPAEPQPAPAQTTQVPS